MTRTSRMQRLLMLAASTAVVVGGLSLPSTAFATPATPHPSDTSTTREDPNSYGGRTEGFIAPYDHSHYGSSIFGTGGGTGEGPGHYTRGTQNFIAPWTWNQQHGA
ncbi:hypothetical protein [Streptomyces sp. NPDC003374]